MNPRTLILASLRVLSTLTVLAPAADAVGCAATYNGALVDTPAGPVGECRKLQFGRTECYGTDLGN